MMTVPARFSGIFENARKEGIRDDQTWKLIREYKREFHVRSEKGEKDRYMPLPAEILEDIKIYIERYRMPSDAKALFTTEKGRMPYGYIRTMIKKLGAKLDMKNLHPHSFRHFYLSQLYAMTDDLRLVQILAGHARIESTTVYEHMSTFKAAEKGRSAVEKFFREEEDLNPMVRKKMGAATNKWAHWDLNPDLRVSLRVIAPVNHQDQMTHI